MASLLGGIGGGREYVLKIVADVKDAVKGVDDVAAKTTSMKDKMIGIGKGIATGLAVAAVADFGMECLDAAANADDAMDAIDSAFGASSKVIADYAKNAADSTGLSTAAYEQSAAQIGRVLTGLGVDQGKAATDTTTLMQRAADAAAIWGVSTDEAAGLIAKGIAGQTRGLKQYGIDIDETKVKARAMAEGYVDASGKVTDAGLAIARQEEIIQATSRYQGEFAKNSGDLGSQQDILRAKMENLKTTIGTALLPVIMKVFDVVQPLITFLSNNMGWILPLVAGITGIVAAIKAWEIAQVALNLVMSANPILLIVTAVAALTAGIIWAYQNVGWFRDAVDAMAQAVVTAFNWVKDVVMGVFNWIVDNWPLLLAVITGPIGIATKLIIDNWDTIKNAVMTVWNWIKENWPLLVAIITGPIGIAVSQVIKHWDSIKNGAQAVVDGIASFFSRVFNIISQPFQDAWNAIKNIPENIKNAFQTMVDRIGQIVSNVANTISAPFKNAFNGIRNLWNSTVGGFGFSIPSWVPGVGGKEFKIPKTASGGIVNRPTVALLGEAGPEAVIPLSQMTPVANTPASVTINVYALTANAEVGRRVLEALQEYQRISGRKIA